jgi:hypothetical protein
MRLWDMPVWVRWTVLSVVGLGVLSVAAIPFVDATRLVPTGGASYAYELELVATDGFIGRVDVVVDGGIVAEVSVGSCRSGLDCADLAAPFIPYEALADEVAGRGWVTVQPAPLLEARSEGDGPVHMVRVLDYREG